MKQTKKFLRPLLMAIVMMVGMLVPQGAWAQYLEVCEEETISSDASYDEIYVYPGGKLIINKGVTLTVTCALNINGFNIDNFGTVINYGTIIGEGYINMYGGVLANHGHIDLSGAGGDGTFYNTGTLGDGYFNLTTTPCDHDDSEDLGTVEATCTHGAGTQFKCYTCHYIWINETGEPKPHDNLDHNGLKVCSVCGQLTFDATPVGEGTAESPYQIANAGHLFWFADKVNNDYENFKEANAVLTADIVVNDGTFAANGAFTATGASEPSTPIEWLIIARFVTYSHGYRGTFDGQGHTISGLYANYECSGLVGMSSGESKIKNVGVTNSYFSGHFVGGICGNAGNNTEISNCYSSNVICKGNYVGGILGLVTNTGVSIVNCYSTASLIGVEDWAEVGGITAQSCSTTNCYTTYGNATGWSESEINCEANVSLERFASGEIAYKLNGSVDGEGNWTAGATNGTQKWYQKLGENGDSYPVLAAAEGNTVYYGYENCLSESETYSNDLRYAEKEDSHDYQVQNVVWSVDYTSATLQLVCSRDAEHTANVAVTDEGITSEDTTPATCTTAGVRTYTATATYEGEEYTGTKEVEIPALGHQFGEDHICTVCHQPAAIAHAGTSGTCTWSIYEDGHMIFEPTTGETGTLEEWWYWYDCPWYDYRDEIKSVKFQGEVIAKTCYGMFYLCTNLTAIDFSGFNTENVTEFDFMFGACLSIQSLNLSGFNTEKAEKMSGMFVSCQALESLDLSSFNTANVQTIAYMFESCTHLATLKLSNDFVLNEGVEKTDLFADCGTWADQLSIYYVIDESIKEALNETETKIEELLMWGKVNFVPSAIVKDGVPFNSTNDRVCNVPAEDVVFTRTFTAEKPASAMLPFTVAASQISGATFYEFKGVAYNTEKSEWVATMQAVSTVEAYKPYVVIREGAGDITFGTSSQTVNFPVTPTASDMTTTDQETGWTFVALNEAKKWQADDEEIGKAYGFAGKNKDYDDYSVAKGEFVKIAAGASAKPGRCYLVKNDGEPLTRATEELPATIKVRFIVGSATGIGTLDTETGEMTLEGWYDLNGNKIEQPSKGGVYINNNKKVMVK